MFPKISAKLSKEGGPSDRYILNQFNSAFVNVIAAYPFCIVPIFFPSLIWLALAPMMFNLAELVLHGAAATAATKSSYNPGLLSCLPWLILSVWYFVYVSTNHLASGSDWGCAAIYLVVWIIVALPLGTFVLLSNRDSRYPFAPEELSKFDKYIRLIRTTIHP
jgi:hypothetical protein